MATRKPLSAETPYYDLPAGLMVPMVPPAEHNYTPLQPTAVRYAPPPAQPRPSVLEALDEFFGPPRRPVNADGWEEGGLADLTRAKRRARPRSPGRSRSPSPAMLRSHSQSPPVTRRSRSRSPRHRSRSPSPSRPAFGFGNFGSSNPPMASSSLVCPLFFFLFLWNK